jgi:large subunit ribosomal protein L17
MMANMVTSLLAQERIKTTGTRAKEVRRFAEHMITFAKRGDLHARRQVLRFVADKQVVKKLFEELGPRYKSRNGGYTRVVKLGPRRGDGTHMSIVELVDRPGTELVEETAESTE